MADNETTRAAAQNALDAYMASEGMTDDPETAIVDLIADLAFLADSMELHGGWVLGQGAMHYSADIAEGFSDQHERDDEDDFELRGPESIDDEVLELESADDDWDDDEDEGCPGHESLDGAHMGETVYCDGSCVTCR